MNLRVFDYLIAVYEYGSFSEAAQKCFVSQPALSIQLKKLEQHLNVQLFERNNKKVIATYEGLKIITQAKKMRQCYEEMQSLAIQAQSPLKRDIRLGVFPTLAPYMLPKITPPLMKAFPEMKLFLLEEKTNILVEKLKQGDIDIALLALPIKEPALESYFLFSEEFLLAVYQNHRLFRRKKIQSQDLKEEEVLLLEEGHCLREQALDFCATHHLFEKQNFRATSLETLRQMVLSKVGITFIPKIAQQHNDGLCYIHIENETPKRHIALFWRKMSSQKEAFLELAHFIKKQMSDVKVCR